jgi:hypothetical protein
MQRHDLEAVLTAPDGTTKYLASVVEALSVGNQPASSNSDLATGPVNSFNNINNINNTRGTT